MFKLLLVFLIVVGGYTLVEGYYPQLLGMNLFHLGRFVITGGILLLIFLIYLGFKFIHA